MYDVSDTVLSDAVSAFEPGTNLLVSGPSVTGKRALAFQLLTAGDTDDGLLLVMTSESAQVALADLDRWDPSFEPHLAAIVDCVGTEARRGEAGGMTRSVSSPANLSTIGVTTTKLYRKLRDQGVSRIGHGFVSVSTMLGYADVETVFKFLHIYTQRISDTGGFGVFTFDPTAHDEQACATIARLFDAVVELREVDGHREYRLTGVADHEPSWRRL